jgi:hypothetical protein
LTWLLPPLPLGSMMAGTPRNFLTSNWFGMHIAALRHWQLMPPCALLSL